MFPSRIVTKCFILCVWQLTRCHGDLLAPRFPLLLHKQSPSSCGVVKRPARDTSCAAAPPGHHRCGERTRYRPDKRQFMDFNLNKSGLTADLRRHLRRSLSCFIKALRHIFYKWTLTGEFSINIVCLFTDQEINRRAFLLHHPWRWEIRCEMEWNGLIRFNLFY